MRRLATRPNVTACSVSRGAWAVPGEQGCTPHAPRSTPRAAWLFSYPACLQHHNCLTYVKKHPLKGRNGTPAGLVRWLKDRHSGTVAMKRILVVDDSPDTADTMAMLLETSGHEVRTATSGADALSIVDSFRPDLVLLDIGMPDMDGYAIARQLRARNALRGALLAAVTGYDGADDRRKSREAGFHHHLVKPVG